jgi:hypothetical protein
VDIDSFMMAYKQMIGRARLDYKAGRKFSADTEARLKEAHGQLRRLAASLSALAGFDDAWDSRDDSTWQGGNDYDADATGEVVPPGASREDPNLADIPSAASANNAPQQERWRNDTAPGNPHPTSGSVRALGKADRAIALRQRSADLWERRERQATRIKVQAAAAAKFDSDPIEAAMVEEHPAARSFAVHAAMKADLDAFRQRQGIR